MVENLVSGKKYRILVDAANDVWDRISFWTKASDVYYDDGTTVEVNKPNAMLKRNTFYSVGSVVYENSAPSWVMFKCTTAGTTAATVPSTYSTISSPGTVITDGTARFTVYDVRPSSTLSTSSYQIPTMSLVNNLSSELTANGTKFYFDYQNGKYGYNTSSARGASTFSPFGNVAEIIAALPTQLTASAYAGSGAQHEGAVEAHSEISIISPGTGTITLQAVTTDSPGFLYASASCNGVIARMESYGATATLNVYKGMQIDFYCSINGLDMWERNTAILKWTWNIS